MEKSVLISKTYTIDGRDGSVMSDEEVIPMPTVMDGQMGDVGCKKFDFVGNEIPATDSIPYVTLYDDPKSARRRSCFIPAYDVLAEITNAERNKRRFSGYLHPFIYTIDLKHGPYQWTVKRRYSDFDKLAGVLKRSRAIGRITRPFRRSTSGEITLRHAGSGCLVEVTDNNSVPVISKRADVRSDPTDDIDEHARGDMDDKLYPQDGLNSSENRRPVGGNEPIKQIKKQRPSRSALSYFPTVPDYCIRKGNIELRKAKLQTFLSELLKVRAFRDHPATARFLGVNRLTFIRELGPKGKEAIVTRRRGGCFNMGSTGHCCLADLWMRRKTWLIVKDSYIVNLDPKTFIIHDVMLFDRGFNIEDSDHFAISEDKSVSRRFDITNKQRTVGYTCANIEEAQSFHRHIKATMMNRGAEWCEIQRFGSSFPIRKDGFARWLVDGEELMRHAADVIDMATEDIYIASWCFHPQIFLRRRPWDDESRMDLLLKKKADQGVKIFILLFREISQFLSGTGSYEGKKYLESLSPNIKVLRHPKLAVDLKPWWTNHEKLLMVDHRIALVAGIDFCYGRWDNAEHRLPDRGRINTKPLVLDEVPFSPPHVHARAPQVPAKWKLSETPRLIDTKGQLWPGKDYISILTADVTDAEIPFEDVFDRGITPRTPWHDMGCAFYGSVAQDITRHFIQRWNAAKVELEHRDDSYPFLLPKCYDNIVVPEIFRQMSYPCNAQVLRSSAEWGASHYYTEDSIHQAYLKLIEEAQHFIYMENPFFVSKGEDPEVKNQVSEAIYRRIVRAYEKHENFRVYIVLPVSKGLAGKDLSFHLHVILGYVRDTGTMLMELYYQYAAISKGEGSLLRRLEKAVDDPSRFISFYAVRTHAELCGRLVTDMIYVHNKLLIVDDRFSLVGSANIDDRSLLGNRDSEVCVLVEDNTFEPSTVGGRPYQAGVFSTSLRKRLMREHLGLLDDHPFKAKQDIDLSDPLSPTFYETWNGIAKRNSEIYEKVFSCSPANNLRTFEQWDRNDKEAVRLSDTNKGQALEMLKGIQGYLVTFPTEFLSEANILTDKTNPSAMAPRFLYT